MAYLQENQETWSEGYGSGWRCRLLEAGPLLRNRNGTKRVQATKSGTRVINYAQNYAQWRSKAEFEAMQRNPEAADHMKTIAALAEFDPIVCEVTSSHSN
jgi:hypothetical protein